MVNPSLSYCPSCARSTYPLVDQTSEDMTLKHLHYLVAGLGSRLTVGDSHDPLSPSQRSPNSMIYEQLQMRLRLSFIERELEKARRSQAEAEQQAIEACLEASRLVEEALLTQMEAEQRAEQAAVEAEKAKEAQAVAEEITEAALIEAEESKALWSLRRVEIPRNSNGVLGRKTDSQVSDSGSKKTFPNASWESYRSSDREQDGDTVESEPKLDIPCTFPVERPKRIRTDDEALAIIREHAARREQNVTIKRVVLDSTLVTLGAGLKVEAISCGFDNGIVEIHNLPLDVEADEIGALFTGASTPFVITNTWQSGNGTISAVALVKAARKQAVVDQIHGRTIRERALRANVPEASDGIARYWMPHHLLSLTWESSNPNHLRAFCDHLKCLLESSPGLVSFEFTTCDPTGAYTAAVARFDSWSTAKEAHDQLAGKRLEAEFPVIVCDLVNRPIQYVLHLPLDQHYIHDSEDVVRNRKSVVSLEDRGVIAQIDYLGSDWFDGWLWSFDLNTKEFLEQILSLRGSGIHTVVRNWLTRSLTFYAESQQAVDDVSAAIKIVIRQSDLPVYLDRVNWRFAQSLQESGGLESLMEELGPDVSFDVARSHYVLKYKGRVHSSQAVQRQLEAVGRSELEPGDAEETAFCPICLEEASVPIELGCGHVYCTECLRQYLVTAPQRDRSLIACIGNSDRCQKPIALPIIQTVLSLLDFDDLVEKTVDSYIDQRPVDYRYCSTPSCAQVYRCNNEWKALTCPSCSITICSTCHGKGHPDNVVCPERPSMSTDSNERRSERLRSWRTSYNGVKKCPLCRTSLQGGMECDHVCRRMICKARICWTCLSRFETVNDVYDHMRAIHGDVDLPPVDVVDQGYRQPQMQKAVRVDQADMQAEEIMQGEGIYEGWQGCILM
ncbi:hypothetical protein AX15_001677 [Amanita polypyramis BW_CC]|nr:hypothetical protein AX15_001677 [Amanita polypyramis BW_CC]